MRGETKVGRQHLERTALIYIRQSTMAQVRDHGESTARQYALAEEAARLGWPGSGIEVIDADLGVSGRSVEGRDGFKGLVARVCLGEIGAIFGLEVSRLARSSADLSRLLEYARLTDTLVIDSDGVYDLAEFNDRLLLGLKGTMSEVLCRTRHRASYDDRPVMPTPTRDRIPGKANHRDEVGIIRGRGGKPGRCRLAGSGPAGRLVVRCGPVPVL
jgi:hypothetical protein